MSGSKRGENRGEISGLPGVRFLDPRKVEVGRNAFDRVRLEIGGDEVYEGVRLARAFPLSKPDQYVSFLTEEGKEIGMLAEPQRLDAASRRIVDEELEMMYYTPIIRQVLNVEGKHGTTTWNVKTDRGDTVILVKDRGDVRRLPGRRILFTDAHGLKYDIPDYEKLDEKSRGMIDGEV
jgi:hypothetical protein